MPEANLVNFHYAYMDMIRYWHPDSERYTGGDALYTALTEGWEIGGSIHYEEFWLMGGRLVVVYHFDLKRGEESLHMPVINNPFVQRLVESSNVKLIALGEKKVKPPINR